MKENIFGGVEAIIFDLDGTLVDSMWIWRQIDIDFLLKRKIELPEDLQKSIEGKSFTETAQYFADRFNLNEPVEVIKKEWNLMALDFYQTKIPLKNNVMTILMFAKENQIKLGIGTSNSRDLLTAVLDSHKIDHYFDSKRTSCEVAFGKPSPDIFLKVASDLGVKPENCLVFEDTYAGILAGKRAGMKTIGVFDALSEPYIEEIKALSDAFVYDFSEVFVD